MDLVLKLRELRRLRGLSQKEVARLSGVGEKTISSFETSTRIGAMKLSQLAKLLRIYGFTEEQFFSRTIEELFDPNAAAHRIREEQFAARLAALPLADRTALLDRFELMLDAALRRQSSAPPAGVAPPHNAPRRAAA